MSKVTVYRVYNDWREGVTLVSVEAEDLPKSYRFVERQNGFGWRKVIPKSELGISLTPEGAIDCYIAGEKGKIEFLEKEIGSHMKNVLAAQALYLEAF